MAGRALSAGELAKQAGVTAATASTHLARLAACGLVTRRVAGRHRFYAIASEDVAAALEALGRILPPRLNATQASASFWFARTCYDHLAGRLGVLLTDTLVDRGFIQRDSGFVLTQTGEKWLNGFGVDVAALRQQRRALIRPCLDWSERRHHLAGAVGAAIASTMLERRWLARIDDSRAVRLTLRGREGLYRALALEIG